MIYVYKHNFRRESPGTSDTESTTKLGSILKEKRRRSRSKDRGDRNELRFALCSYLLTPLFSFSKKNGSPALPQEVQKELNNDFDTSNISDNAKKWLEERIAEQVCYFVQL